MKRYSAIAIISVAVATSSSSVWAQWSADPMVNTPVANTPDRESGNQVVSDGAGGAIISWIQSSTNNSDKIIAMQRLDSQGIAKWGTAGVTVTSKVGVTGQYGVVSDNNGGAVVMWVDDRNGNQDIYAQRVDASGNRMWDTADVPVCTNTSLQEFPNICSDGADGAIINWTDARVSQKSNIYAQRLNGAGAIQWAIDGVAVAPNAALQAFSDMSSDGAGGALITWEDSRNIDPNVSAYIDVYAQRINGAGLSLWAPSGLAVSLGEEFKRFPLIVSDGAGGGILTWHNLVDSDNIEAQRVDSAGVPLWNVNGVVVAATDNARDTVIIPDGSGGAILAWSKKFFNSDIWAQRIDSDGISQWGAGGTAICEAANFQHFPKIVSDNAGGAVITWADNRSGSGSSIFAQRVDGTGLVQWATDGAVVCNVPGSPNNVKEIADGTGGFIFAWQDSRTDLDNPQLDIYASRLNGDGTLTGLPSSATDWVLFE